VNAIDVCPLPYPRPSFYNGEMGRLRIPEDVMEYFKKTGSIGGKTRAKKYSKAQLSKWGKLGGRPKGSGKKRLAKQAAKKGGK
jgi:hypothetical protein